MISEHKIADFGALLKGQDFKDNGLISRGDFYQTIMSIPEFTETENGLLPGDVMELLREYDPDNTGYIDLQELKDRLDDVIPDYRYRITLKSKVKEACDEAIVERVTKSKSSKRHTGVRRDLEKPKNLKSVALDIFCGLRI